MCVLLCVLLCVHVCVLPGVIAGTHEEVAEQGCCAMWNLTAGNDVNREAGGVAAIEAVVGSLKANVSSTNVVRQACVALQTLTAKYVCLPCVCACLSTARVCPECV